MAKSTQQGVDRAGSGADIERMPRELVLLEQACAFLEQCQDIDEVKKMRDKAEALRLYHRKQSDSQRAMNAAAAVKLRAEHRLGELLREMPKNEGGRPGWWLGTVCVEKRV